jgi:dTDP-L-rhamnose 4-epimerase
VTGGAGFIGSHTVDLLLARGIQVRVMDALLPPVHRPDVIPSYLATEAEFVRGDVRDAQAWHQALRDVDAVVHLAAYQDYLTDFSKFFHVNAVGTALLYETIVECKLSIQKVVVASSQAVYGEGKYLCSEHDAPVGKDAGRSRRGKILFPPMRPESQLIQGRWEVRCPECGHSMQWVPADEGHTNPHNQYAMSKFTQELMAINFGQRYSIPTTCLRYSIVQGPRQSFRNAYSGILRTFTQRLLAGHAPVCYEDGLQTRDYVYVGDVARANLLALEEPRTDMSVFNVGGRQAVTVMQYAELLSSKINPLIQPDLPGLYRFGDTRHIVSDIAKLSSLGWAPTKPIDEIADEYIEWARAQSDLRDYYVEAEAGMRARGTLRSSGNQ